MQHAHKIDLENAKPQIHSRNCLGGPSAWIKAPHMHYPILKVKKWTDFKMHCTAHLQPWEVCAGGSRTGSWSWILVWHGGKLESCPCGCDTEKAQPVAQPLKSRVVGLLSSLIPTLWFISGRGLYLTVSSDSSRFLIEGGVPSGASCSTKNACFPSVFP